MKEKRIMIVEDERIIALSIARHLGGLGYGEAVLAASGEEALAKLTEMETRPVLVLMDIVLGGKMDGIEAAERIRRDFDIPVVYLTAYADDRTIGRAKATEPFGYLLKPVDRKDLHVAIELALYKYGMEQALRESRTRLRCTLQGTIEAIAETIELKGSFTPGHHRRVSRLAVAIAGEMGLTAEQVRGVELASLVYDIGLVKIPLEFSQNADRLDEVRLSVYRSYPQAGHRILSKIAFPWPIAEMVLQHREHMDGSGFPLGLKGEEILVEARIIGMVDALEGWMTNRNSRSALTLDAALEEVARESGARYDPRVVAACRRLVQEKGFTPEG